MKSKIFQKFRTTTFILTLLILIFLAVLTYVRFGPIHDLRNAFAQNETSISNLKSQQKDKQELLDQISIYRDGLHALDLVLEGRKNVLNGGDPDNPYLIFDLRQVLNDLKQIFPEDARATQFQINNKGLITLPIESVDYASLGRVLKSFKDKSQQIPDDSNSSINKAFREVKIPSGVQRSIQQVNSEKLLKNVYSFVLQAQLNPEFWQNAMSYSDVDPSSYYAQAIQELTLMGGIEGYPDGTFKPLQAITRAEFFKVALFQFLAKKLITIDEYKHYVDLSDEDWPYEYIQLATRMGLGQGDGGRFRPEENISRIEALATVLNIFSLKAEAIDLKSDFVTLPFVDLDQDTKNVPLIFTAYKNGMLENMGQEFKADEPVSRSEVAYWVWKLQSD